MTGILQQTDQKNFFLQHGYLDLGDVVDTSQCADLLEKIQLRQAVDAGIFMTRDEFDSNPVFRGVNPMPGRNLLEHFENELVPIERTGAIVSALSDVLGDRYEIFNKKVICGVPESWIPDWLLERIRENPVNNLGAYIRPELRNMTCFYGIDFHQDIIDWPDCEPDFITLYIYLHDVGGNDAPLQLLAGSHALGVDRFPHQLEAADTDKKSWHYASGVIDHRIDCAHLTITGKTGHVGLWHACTLHGTQPNTSSRARFSLRYLIRRLPDSRNAAIDQLNQQLPVLRFSKDMRLDLDPQGKTAVKKNYLYSSRKDTTGSS